MLSGEGCPWYDLPWQIRPRWGVRQYTVQEDLLWCLESLICEPCLEGYQGCHQVQVLFYGSGSNQRFDPRQSFWYMEHHLFAGEGTWAFVGVWDMLARYIQVQLMHSSGSGTSLLERDWTLARCVQRWRTGACLCFLAYAPPGGEMDHVLGEDAS